MERRDLYCEDRKESKEDTEDKIDYYIRIQSRSVKQDIRIYSMKKAGKNNSPVFIT